MPTKTIAQALFSWREDGKSRIAFRGETVEISADVVARVEQHGVFEVARADAPTPTESVSTAEPASAAVTDTAPAINYPDRPKNTAPGESWIEYAVALYKATNGVLGLDLGAATLLDRQALIAALTEQEQ